MWGFSEFRPLQREAMHAILDSRDSIVVLPTGGGKSLCFQAPAVAAEGLGLVVSQLISLMKDQVDGLRVDGVAASFLNSTLPPHERDEVIRACATDAAGCAYVSPERAGRRRRPVAVAPLKQASLKFIAIDEAAHQPVGHDSSEYRQLGRLGEDFPGVSFHAFTATATERARRDIVTELRLHEPLVLVGSFDRPNSVPRDPPRASPHAAD